VSEDLLNEINSNGEYFGMGTLSGLFSEDYYIAGVRCLDEEGNTIAVVIAATMAAETRALMQDVMRTYVLIVFLTLILTLIISWFLSDILTRPLKGIVGAAKQFARGKFDVRVPEDNYCDEIDELAVSFNNMVSILQQQEALSRDFVANVSHELKTPMTSISGFADGILDGTIPPEKHRHYLEIISQESHRLSRMVVRMLDTARIESGEIVITPMPFDLSDTAIQVLLSFEKQLENKKLDVNVDLEDYLMVNGDHDYIYRVVYNLVDNAVKFVEENGRLTIKTEISGKTARFTIRNTGSEIPQEDLPHVFDRFYKVDRSRSMDRTGAGLGLYLVKSIVILHGGNISVGSNNGETEFSFTIPLAPKPTNTSSNVPELTQN
jgi:signal transduction histidine kinase